MPDSTVERVSLEQLDPSWNPFQSQFWARAKRFAGWRPFAFRFTTFGPDGTEKTQEAVLVLVRRMILGTRLAYVPFAPSADLHGADPSQLARDFARLARPLLPKGTAFMRFDLPWLAPGTEDIQAVTGKNLRLCRESVQPEGTARIDLSDGYDAVRLRYRERARRNIRKAMAKSIEISCWKGDEATYDRWYGVYLETAKRDGFTARSSAYIKHMLETRESDVRAYLYLARSGNTILGGAIILESEHVALYLYGASVRVDGSSPSYLLQDHAIREACARGRMIYDLYGISGPRQRGSHLEGLRLFKRAFGGYVCYRPQSFDHVYKPLFRFAYTRLENMRYAVHRKRHPRRMSQQFSVSTEE
jgi:lipid II:glycine glycyltransferase (peptidoglycan interpeptide bridge formation enzyme)